MPVETLRGMLEHQDQVPRATPPQPTAAALTPPPVFPVAPEPPGQPGANRLMVQIRGLLIELGEAQSKADVKEREMEDLQGELERLRSENRELKERLART